jgi:YfiH family protein
VDRNRELVQDAVGRELAWGWQVHGTDIQEWGERPPELARVDAHVTSRDDIALLVLVADCLPVALADGDRVAMAHCGWRGLAGGLIAKAAAAFDQPPAAAVGPGIGPCCYEVGDEVRSQFDARFAVGRMLDLRGVADDLLRSAGVERVEHLDMCTSCREDLFFSHRRDDGVTGRQGGLVWRD